LKIISLHNEAAQLKKEREESDSLV